MIYLRIIARHCYDIVTISVRQLIQYHKWRTYDRFASDHTINLGQILRHFANQTPEQQRLTI